MRIFGFQITRYKPAPAAEPVIRDVTIEDWLRNKKAAGVAFGIPYNPGPRERVECQLNCNHDGNRVSSEVQAGANPEEAFAKALNQIERTVGREWRELLP